MIISYHRYVMRRIRKRYICNNILILLLNYMFDNPLFLRAVQILEGAISSFVVFSFKFDLCAYFGNSITRFKIKILKKIHKITNNVVKFVIVLFILIILKLMK